MNELKKELVSAEYPNICGNLKNGHIKQEQDNKIKLE